MGNGEWGVRIADCGLRIADLLVCSTTRERSRLKVISICTPHSPSVNLWLRCLSPRMQKIEVASLICLRDVSAEEGAEATLVTRRRRRPSVAPSRHLFFVDQQIQFSSRHVQFYQISVARERQRPADVTFGRDVQHAGAV